MFGIAVNALAIVLGAVLGRLFQGLIPKKVHHQLEQAMGVVVMIIGIRMALEFQNILVLISCVAVGGLMGTLLELENRVAQMTEWLQKNLSGDRESKFVEGLSTTTMLFCVGAMAVVGSIQSGLTGNHEVLLAKSLIDGVTNIIFASIYGLGVALAAIPVVIYQGAIALLASQLEILSSEAVLAEISGVGGVLVLMIGLRLSGLTSISPVNYLPGIFLVLILAPFLA